jgi:rhomboid protease GluP
MGDFEQHLLTNGLSKKERLVIAFETVKHLGWRTRFTSDSGIIAYTENGEFEWNGEVTVNVDEDVTTIKCVSISNMLNDFGKSRNAVEKYAATFEKMKLSFSEEEIDHKYEEYEKDFLPPYEDILKPDITPNFPLFSGFLSYFKPAQGYFITPILINLNIAIFVIMVATGISIFEPNVESMILWGANSTANTLEGQWWRLVSNCFIHFGIIHLLLNMYALFYVGFLLEPFMGKAKFLTAYLLTGIVASLASLWWHDNTVSAGASGAVFGLYGVFLALLTTNHIERSMRNALLGNIAVFVVYNLVYGSLKGGIDNAAHLGGLLSGLLIGYANMPALKKPDDSKLKKRTLTLIPITTIICSIIIYAALFKSDRFIYQKRIEAFYKLEDNALSVLEGNENKSNVVLLSGLQQGVEYWKKGINLITELDKLDLSEKVHARNKILIRYCNLRIQSYQLISQNINLSLSTDTPQLQQINQQIKAAISELSQ